MRFPLVNFSKGEVSEELQARFDVQAYGSAAKRARNVRVKKYGGLEKRPGTRFVAEVFDDSAPVRLVPFQFSLTDTYALEMGQGYMRVASNGGMVLGEELAVTGLTSTYPVTVTAAFHGYSEGDQVFFKDQTGDWAILNGRFVDVLASTGDDTFTIDFDGTGFAAFGGSTGGIVRDEEPDPPPPPPPVPDPVPPPPPPPTGGPMCVADDTLILMADGSHKLARDIEVGDILNTRHEETMELGHFPVSAISFAERAVWRFERDGNTLLASRGHRIWLGTGWVEIERVGHPAGNEIVARITVAGAHTYMSNGFLSHNAKPYDPSEEPV